MALAQPCEVSATLEGPPFRLANTPPPARGSEPSMERELCYDRFTDGDAVSMLFGVLSVTIAILLVGTGKRSRIWWVKLRRVRS